FRQPGKNREKGQSIVLIALALVGLLAFAGLAIDVGFIFARGSQLQAAIDAAALAGVTELTAGIDPNTLAIAKTTSGQFLNANGMPISVTQSLDNTDYVYATVTPLGIINYSITATWPVETFFMRAIGLRDNVNLTRSATAAVFNLTDIYASRRVESGVLTTSNQAVFGPECRTSLGDPFSPWSSQWAPQEYSYRYRIYIPSDYAYDIVRVELFDPDSINQADNIHDILRSYYATTTGGLSGMLPNQQCTGSSGPQQQPCLLPTGETTVVNGELTGINGLSLDQVNPFWFVRIDENREGRTNGPCNMPPNYEATANTRTLYELYYYLDNSGIAQRVNLSSYTGQVGDGARDNGEHKTDMRWVSPGSGVWSYSDQWDGGTGNGIPLQVPVDPGSATGFEINLNSDVPGIIQDPSTGARYIWIDVTTLNGSSENGFEIWAGPPENSYGIPSEVNARNLSVLDPNRPNHSSAGITVFAVGNLPMNSNINNEVDIPLIYVGPELAGETIFVSLFDPDSGAELPITFYFDSIAQSDWSLIFGDGGTDPDGVPANSRCQYSSNPPCQDRWVDPPYQITIPGDTSNCDYSTPGDPDCVPFYGGRLIAHYKAGNHDTYGWQITVTGLPYLVK
ncbi:MAG TPA: hypothetical protein EYP41_20785, partial [Anaerolineae bacterium]|nr:hypothetical protein [Anaerolineae bacterium]